MGPLPKKGEGWLCAPVHPSATYVTPRYLFPIWFCCTNATFQHRRRKRILTYTHNEQGFTLLKLGNEKFLIDQENFDLQEDEKLKYSLFQLCLLASIAIISIKTIKCDFCNSTRLACITSLHSKLFLLRYWHFIRMITNDCRGVQIKSVPDYT